MTSEAIPAGAVAARPLWGDERLALRVAEGDERAFAALYERYHQRLFRYCVSILRDEADASDALQSTFERALCALRAQQRNAPLRPWLYRIAHNEAITLIRRRPPEPALGGGAPAWAASAEHEAAQRDRLATLVGDLAALPERARSALVMRELEGLSHEDIAIALDTTVGAAKQAIFEARSALATLAEGREMSCTEIRRLVSDGDRRVLRGRRVRGHLGSCRACAEFAGAIARRREDLRAVAPPLAPVAAAAILAHIAGGAGHGTGAAAGAAAGGSWGAAGGAGKGLMTVVLGSKAVAGAALLATATAGVAAIQPLVSHPAAHRSPSVPSRPALTASPASRPASGRAATPGARSVSSTRAASVLRRRGAVSAASPAGHGHALRHGSAATGTSAHRATRSGHGLGAPSAGAVSMPQARAGGSGASASHGAAMPSRATSSHGLGAGRPAATPSAGAPSPMRVAGTHGRGATGSRSGAQHSSAGDASTQRGRLSPSMAAAALKFSRIRS